MFVLYVYVYIFYVYACVFQLVEIPAVLFGQTFWQRSLVGYSLWGREESDMTERLHFTSLLTFPLKLLVIVESRDEGNYLRRQLLN